MSQSKTLVKLVEQDGKAPGVKKWSAVLSTHHSIAKKRGKALARTGHISRPRPEAAIPVLGAAERLV